MSYCDLESGLCGGESTQTTIQLEDQEQQTTFEILYATDPICSHCWAMEPAWRKFLFHYGQHVHVRHLYGGLLPGWQGFADRGAGIFQPADVAPHWTAVSEHYQQPINPSVWLTDPLDSSYPASIAVHAVRLLAPEQESTFLRRIREMLFLEARNIARLDILIEAAEKIGIDAAQFRLLLESGIAERGFQQDLQEVKQLPVRGFPTLIMRSVTGQTAVLGGTQSFTQLEKNFLNLTGLSPSTKTPSITEVMAVYQTATTRELADVLNFPLEDTFSILRTVGTAHVKTGESLLWIHKES